MMTIGYAVCFLTILLLKAYGADEKTFNDADADDYLEKYGYSDLVGKGGNGRQRSLAKTRAVKSFQEFANLPVTGRLDEPTKRAMLAPRCGVVDKPKTTRAGFAKWQKSVLKWALERPTSQLDSGRVRTAIRQALEVWSTVVPLNFTEVSAGSSADMQFAFGARDHGDGYHFDGRSGVLAHAFFPSDGRLHFDDDEMWAFEDGAKINQGYTDLLSVTIHELGHSLGLPHSSQQEAIMYPWYRAPEVGPNGVLKQFQLSHFDISDIQAIYGPRQGGATARPPTNTEPPPPGPPSSCPRFEAAVTAIDGTTYFFTNQNVGWTKSNANGAANSATTFYVNQKFPGFPSSGITAAVTGRYSQLTFLFQRRRVYAYSWKASTKSFTLAEGYPKDLQADVPFEPEAAVLLKEGHTILIKGDQFLIWDSGKNSGSFKNSLKAYYPKMPANPKVSFSVGEDQVYFINGDNYSVFDFRSSSVVSTSPLKNLITC